MAAWRYEISLLVLKKYSTLEEKFRISARPCNILYIRSAVAGGNPGVGTTEHWTDLKCVCMCVGVCVCCCCYRC